MRRAALLVCVVLLVTCSGAYAGPDPSERVKHVVPEFTFAGPIAEALDECEDAAGVDLRVDWTGLAASGVRPSTNVEVSVEDATVGEILDTTLAAAEAEVEPLGWYAGRVRIYVSTRAALLTGAPAIAAAERREAEDEEEEKRDRHEGEAGPDNEEDDQVVDRRETRPIEGRFDMDSVALADVIEFFRHLSDVNIHVNWTSLEPYGIGRDTPVTLKANGITIARALDLVMAQLSGARDKFDRVYWVIDEDVVEIASGAALNAEVETRVYDVRHLLYTVPNFVGPRVDLGGADADTDGDDDDGAALPDPWGEDDAEDADSGDEEEELRTTLIEIVRDSIGRDMWIEGGGKGSVKMVRGQLIVTQTPLGFKLFEQVMRLH